MILGFGDSTTSGKAVNTLEGGSFGGGAWRTGCFQRLAAAGNSVTFVGQYESGATDGLYDATGRHEGLSGVKLDTLTSSMAAQVAAASPAATVITLLCGINDIDQGEGADLVDRMTAALDTLRDAAGDVVPILAANLTPTLGKSYDAEIVARSAALTALINARTDRVFLVDSQAALIAALDLNAGGIHPNSIGYAKLGRAFANKIFEVMP